MILVRNARERHYDFKKSAHILHWSQAEVPIYTTLIIPSFLTYSTYLEIMILNVNGAMVISHQIVLVDAKVSAPSFIKF